jgi:ribosomal protein S27AE
MDQEEVFVVVQECPECGNENMQAVPGDDGMRLVCPECETELAGA